MNRSRPDLTGGDAVLAVDGGGTKTDMVLLGIDGRLLGHVRGPGSNPHVLGWEATERLLTALRTELLERAPGRRLIATHAYLAGLDLPEDIVRGHRALADWKDEGGAPNVIDNDMFALLRAGTSERDAVAVVCGTGINAVGVRSDGATVRFPALGEISGDWGGGAQLGAEALWHAARAEDGRGPRTLLAETVPEALGFLNVGEIIEALHFGQIDADDTRNRLCRVLFDTAARADPVSKRLVVRQAEEIVVLVTTTIDRLGLHDQTVPIVLGGGVLAARPPLLVDGVLARLGSSAPSARPLWVTAPPVLGAGLAALDAVGADDAALRRCASAIESRHAA
ncbi:N-acetylglucosamine kinase [Humibacter ginsenosidimutans]|nr:BadF/BadG/BcrA/BcrD ATPase family protein [Humibacter ginsenosidimutans]